MKPEEMKKEFRNLVAELKESVETGNKEAQDKINARMDKLEGVPDKIDELEMKLESLPKAAPVDDKGEGAKAEFRQAFKDFYSGKRRNLAETKFTKSVSDSTMVRFDFESAGALVVPPEIGSEMIRQPLETTPVFQLVRVTSTNSPSYVRYVELDEEGGAWLNETDQATEDKLKYNKIETTIHDFASYFSMSKQQQDDTGFDIVSEATNKFQRDFRRKVGKAVVSGDGDGKPTGLIGNIDNFDSGSLTLVPKMLIDLQEELEEEYQPGAAWLLTRKTRANIRTLFLSSNNASLQYLWEPSFKAGIPTQLLGAPVAIAREGDMAGKNQGAFTAGQVPVLYGDMAQAYELYTHTDVFILDDPYSDARRFVRNMNMLSRIGGGVMQAKAAKQLTMTS